MVAITFVILHMLQYHHATLKLACYTCAAKRPAQPFHEGAFHDCRYTGSNVRPFNSEARYVIKARDLPPSLSPAAIYRSYQLSQLHRMQQRQPLAQSSAASLSRSALYLCQTFDDVVLPAAE